MPKKQAINLTDGCSKKFFVFWWCWCGIVERINRLIGLDICVLKDRWWWRETCHHLEWKVDEAIV